MKIKLSEDEDYTYVCHYIEKQLKIQLSEYGAYFTMKDIRAFREFCKENSDVDTVKSYATENLNVEFV